MLNLEWIRTFRTVYKTKSLSRAAEQLNISQPTVSQQLTALEARIGQKLFSRKSKGVLETDYGKMLNTMISGSIEALEKAELEVIKTDSKIKNIISFGISLHLYKSILCNRLNNLGEYVHIKFAEKDELLRGVNDGSLLYAIIPDDIDTFDTICHPLIDQKLVLVSSPDIDLDSFVKTYQKDQGEAETWLDNQIWYAHDNNSNFIKLYWLKIFNKKRPSIIPNYIIPNEYETLFQLSRGTGLAVAFDTIAKPFVEEGSLRSVELQEITYRQLSLFANKKKNNSLLTQKILALLNS